MHVAISTVQCFLSGVHRIAGRMLGRSDNATAAVHHRRTAGTAHGVVCVWCCDGVMSIYEYVSNTRGRSRLNV